MFSLSLATLTEYTDTLAVVYLAIIPALAATFLYTAAMLVAKDPAASERVMFTGFILWVLLITLNVARVIIDWRKQLRQTRGS